MAARIVFISARSARLRRDRTLRLRQEAMDLAPDAPDLSRDVLALLDRHTAAPNTWSFVMLGSTQNRAVVRWIEQHAKRARTSRLLWAEFFCNLRTDTGQITMSRTQMAEAVGAAPRHVSEALSEFLRMGALIRHQEGREVRWFMNPMVGTCLPAGARDEAQRAAPPLLTVVQGGVQNDAT